MLTGAWIARFDARRNAWIQVEESACVATWASPGKDHAPGQVCARTRGTRPLGDLWLCPHHYRGVLAAAQDGVRAVLAEEVPLDSCVFPQYGATRLNPPTAPLCGRPASTTIGDAGVCAHHVGQALAWHQEISRREAEITERAEAQQRERLEKGWEATGPEVVYYLRRADGAIKIGTTVRLAERRTALQGDHGPLELLLTHCGSYDRESRMRAKFRALRVGRTEWFLPGPRLLDWIADARRKRDNARTVLAGTVPLERMLDLLAAAREQEAA